MNYKDIIKYNIIFKTYGKIRRIKKRYLKIIVALLLGVLPIINCAIGYIIANKLIKNDLRVG